MTELVQGIYLSDNPAEGLEVLLEQLDYSQLVVITDENTNLHCLAKKNAVTGNALNITIPAGEEYKNLSTCEKVWEEMTRNNLDRKAVVVNLGGGVVGDLGGFCAATYKRGIRFINLPTTLLAQVDASVGGKQGVDFLHYKNQIGVFKQPEAVVIHPGFLSTLPENELVSGFSEIVKHALISDKSLWQRLNKVKPVIEELEKIIPEAVKIKYEVVKADPLEQGKRKLLNFGHTLGHAVESYLLGKQGRKILHGEAVAAGIIMESWLSWQMDYLEEADFQEILEFIRKIFPHITFEENEIPMIAKFLHQDKKNERGELKFSLLDKIGRGIYDVTVPFNECEKALYYYRGL